MGKKRVRRAPPAGEVEDIPVRQLHFDIRNPRLAELGLNSGTSESEILRVLWTAMAVNELTDAISANGYFRHEPLMATRRTTGGYTVIEGNRRLAAVKLLLSARLRASIKAGEVRTPKPTILAQLKVLPVVVCTRKKVWHYLGFKHVNGPQPWDSYSKAQYIAEVRNEQNVSLDDIAETIGDRHATVRRLYRGLMAVRQAEAGGVFQRSDRYRTRFAFSTLYTGLDYPGFQSFLGYKQESSYKPNFIPRKRVARLGELCRWVFGSKSANVPPIVRSQNPDLKILDHVLLSKDGVAALRQGLPLQTAVDVSKGDEQLFREFLVQAKVQLESARGKVLYGYHGESDLFQTVTELTSLVESLHEDMQKIRRKSRAKRN